MLGDIAGYCTIKTGAKAFTPGNIEDFYNRPLRVLEFARDGGVLVVDSKGTALAMFEKEDIQQSFRCTIQGQVICPHNLDLLGIMAYSIKRFNRKGGYNHIIQQMVIMNSLRKGYVDDDFLFQVEREQQQEQENAKV